MDDWIKRAACRGFPTVWWFPEGGGALPALPFFVCSQCKVADTCLDYAIDNHIKPGIWGGMSENERKVERRARKGTDDNRVDSVAARSEPAGCDGNNTSERSDAPLVRPR